MKVVSNNDTESFFVMCVVVAVGKGVYKIWTDQKKKFSCQKYYTKFKIEGKK